MVTMVVAFLISPADPVLDPLIVDIEAWAWVGSAVEIESHILNYARKVVVAKRNQHLEMY